MVRPLLTYSAEEATRHHESFDAVGPSSVPASSLSFFIASVSDVPDHLSCLEDVLRQYLSLCHSNTLLNNDIGDTLQVVNADFSI